MIKVNIVYIKKEYFETHIDYVEILDKNNIKKALSRKYIYIPSAYKNNAILIPLRTILPDSNYKIDIYYLLNRNLVLG